MGRMPTKPPTIGVELCGTRAHAVLLAPRADALPGDPVDHTSEDSGGRSDPGGRSDTGPTVEAEVSIAAEVTACGEDPTAALDAALAALVRADRRAATAAQVCVATDAFERALETGIGLARVGCVRLGAGEEPGVPPFFGWPESLAAVAAHHRCLRGGCTYDATPLGEPQPAVIAATAEGLRAAGVEAVAVTAAFSPVDDRWETRLASRLAALLPGMDFSVSAPLGSVGVLPRENAAALNAALLPPARRLTTAAASVVRAHIPGARTFLTRCDATLMELPFARRFPVLALGSVAAARCRGAARLAGLATCVVADRETGRTAVVRDGRPVLSGRGQDILGVETSLAGVEWVLDPQAGQVPGTPRSLDPGPVRVTLVSAAEGRDHLAGADRVGADRAAAERAAAERAAVDRVGADRAAAERAAADRSAVERMAADRVVRAPRAGAVGAVGSRIAGYVDCIVPASGPGHDQALARARARAEQNAVMAGAAVPSVRIVGIDESPVAYVPGDLVRLRVTAAGELVPGG